jgi:hypothetical protein
MPAERKRPFYLVLALLGALALGIQGAYWGWGEVALCHATLDPSMVGQGLTDEHARAAALARVEAALHALDLAKSREWPLAVASLVLGAATLLFAMRAMAGSRDARRALVQLVLVQAGVHVASHLLLRDVADAKYALEAQALSDERTAAGSPEAPIVTAGMLRTYENTAIVLRTITSLLVIVGLTRRRSRDYFGEAPSPVGDG